MAKDKNKMSNAVENASEQLKPEETVDDSTMEKSAAVADDEASAKVEVELSETEKLQRQVKELEDRLVRQAAEFENYKKRTARNFNEMIRSASDRILGEILDVVDNFDRALSHANGESDTASLKEGMEMIAGQLHTLIGKHDVTPIEAIGNEFDPNLHEALMQVESDEFAEGVVAVEIARGYQQGDKVLRHSKVGVSTGKKKEK